jgi:transient receptor potential cation channel subfamily M protein 2
MNKVPVVDKSIKQELLNPDHSHFILVDNAKLNDFGGEIDFRIKLEKEISKGNQKTKPIPLIMVVIEGGPNTVKCVLQSVKNGIPCVFIDVIFFSSKFKY